MRSLIYVPVVHSAVDLGSVADEVLRQVRSAFGADASERRAASIEAMWVGLREKLLALPLDWQRTRLYQDGLPVCGREEDIVRDLASQSSRNHQLLVELMARGAKLMGTEEPALMVAEYRRVQKLVLAAEGQAPDAVVVSLKREGDALLQARDAFIADRIDKTLLDGETAILFIGLLHRVDEILAGKFDERHLIHSLPLGAERWWKFNEGGHGA
ncbi:MAG: hypothetical protein HYY84_04460 [Deltaproteobacteria bacterium]|nr:hypothetical protein [Deltaproteobacteria bacterium]